MFNKINHKIKYGNILQIGSDSSKPTCEMRWWCEESVGSSSRGFLNQIIKKWQGQSEILVVFINTILKTCFLLSEIVIFYFQLCTDTLLDVVFLSNEEISSRSRARDVWEWLEKSACNYSSCQHCSLEHSFKKRTVYYLLFLCPKSNSYSK